MLKVDEGVDKMRLKSVYGIECYGDDLSLKCFDGMMRVKVRLEGIEE